MSSPTHEHSSEKNKDIYDTPNSSTKNIMSSPTDENSSEKKKAIDDNENTLQRATVTPGQSQRSPTSSPEQTVTTLTVPFSATASGTLTPSTPQNEFQIFFNKMKNKTPDHSAKRKLNYEARSKKKFRRKSIPFMSNSPDPAGVG